MVKFGIYKITNTVNDKFYIGSSTDIARRFGKPKGMLIRKQHRNPILQHSWNFHGADNFAFEIVEECAADRKLLLEREQQTDSGAGR